ncbi:MAG: 3-phosphoshikimate 1-carboxyvinyltransferase [candidate division Zixibacteria bacterium]|nr:3-phosphoshikimate 1-carboxyvinyltransferase [candidate division Zixibacteria bacterium]
MEKIVKRVKRVNGTVKLPGDRSITHRAVILASLADDICEIFGISNALECQATIDCLKLMGIEINGDSERLEVIGKGIDGYSPPEEELNVGNSITALCLLTGIMAGYQFDSVINTASTQRKRSLKALIEALQTMGAKIESNDYRTPLKISGTTLKGSEFAFSEPSAHTKSAVLFAALKAEGETIVNEAIPSRDHTERMINHFGIPIEMHFSDDPTDYDELDRRMKRIKQKQMFREKGGDIHVWGIGGISPTSVSIPGDISLAAPLVTAATILKNSNLQLENMGFNPTRSGFVDLVKRMGANFSFSAKKDVSGEPVIDLGVRTASLRGRRLGGAIVHNMVDEVPILAILASQSEGTTVIREADQLRRRETDRLHATFLNLRKMGAKVGELRDGLVIEGKSNLTGGELDCYNDNRLIMAFTIAALAAEGETLLKNVEGISNTFPDFWQVIDEITEGTALG